MVDGETPMHLLCVFFQPSESFIAFISAWLSKFVWVWNSEGQWGIHFPLIPTRKISLGLRDDGQVVTEISAVFSSTLKIDF